MTPEDRHRRHTAPRAPTTAGRSSPTRGSGTLLVVAAVLIIGASIGAAWLAADRLDTRTAAAGDIVGRVRAWMLQRRASDLVPVGSGDEPVTFVVSPGEGLARVADRLAAEGLVRDAGAFLLLAKVRGTDRTVQAGEHVLDDGMTADEVLTALQVGSADSVTVTLPEGLRVEEVAALLAGNGVSGRDAFLAAAAPAGPTGRPTVDERPAGVGLEGYLFPDTYSFDRESPADLVVARLLDNFESRIGALRGSEWPSGLSAHEIVTLASIVEREAVLASERPRIARVFHNRLQTPPYLLNADPTLQYALGFQPEAQTWWKRPLSSFDLEIDSPYNTYVRPGLPPGPIASPGFDSLEAAARPADGDWQYFVADGRACDGSHLFAVTYDEHLSNVALARQGDCGG